MNMRFESPQQYRETILQGPHLKPILEALTQEKLKQIESDIEAEYWTRMGSPDVMDPDSFEVMVIVADKA